MKTIKKLFTALLLLCSTVASAHDFEVDGIYYNITDETAKTVEVTYKGDTYLAYSDEYSGNVVIPSSVACNETTYSVTSIKDYAFYVCTDLANIEIPNSVTSIGKSAFRACDGLTSVEIPNSVTSIGDDAFRNCTGLTNVTIPNSVTTIGYDAFSGCTSLTSIEIPNSITSVGESAFNGTAWYNNQPDGVVYVGKVLYKYKGTMPNNTSIIVKEGTISISQGAFYNCTGLTSITIPNSVTSIGVSAFKGCTGLTSIEIPNSVTTIGSNAFSGTGLKSVTIPNCITSISNAFSGCESLTSIEIPASVTTIGNGAFNYCTSLASITIPNSVTTIGGYAFNNCTSLTSITIPNSVTSIGISAFYETAWYNNQPDGVIYAGKVLYGYKGTMPDNTSITIKEGTLSITADAFRFCTGLTGIEIPNSVTAIGTYAFENCSLTSVKIPNSITRIEAAVFFACQNLSSVDIPNGVTSIGNSAFFDCRSLTSIEIPNSITSIGDDAFTSCSALTSIVVANENAIYDSRNNCNAIIETATNTLVLGCKNTTIPNSVTSIGDSAFESCTGLTSITIPNSVTTIDGSAFYYCTGLKEIYSLAETPATIDSSTFDDYSATIYVPYGAKETYETTDGWSNFSNIVEMDPEEVTITIGEYGSATYCSEFALDFSNVEGLKAYAATGYNTNTQVVTLTRVQTSKESIGLFLVGEPGEYTVPIIETSTDYTLNLLVGTLEETDVNGTSADGNYYNFKYTVAETSETPLFYQFEDASSLSAGKAYLQLPASLFPATVAKAISMRFDEGATTDIDEITDNRQQSTDIYDLNGRRVETPTNGIYIVNGKKVIVNNK